MPQTAHRATLAVTIVAAGLMLGSCGGGDKVAGPSTRPVPARMDVVSGDGQLGTVGTPLANPLVVRVVDASGNPIAGQIVNFRVLKGGGTVFAGAGATNIDGLVQERWTLGTVARDTQQVEARAVDAQTGDAIVFATFKAVGQPGPATELRKILGDAQPGTAGQPLADSLVVMLVDSYGNGVSAGTVTWTTASGSLSAATSATDTTGRAAARWTLGTAAGQQQSSARSGSLAPVTFVATAHGGAPASIIRVSADGGEYPVGSAAGDSVAVRVKDAYGNPSAGATVSFAITAGNGSVAPASAVANADGIAKARWVLGTVAGANALRVSAGTVQLDFTATGRAGGAASIAKNGADPAGGVVGTAVAPRPSVIIRDVYGNPLRGAEVMFTVTAGNGQLAGATQLTDADGVATVGSWTLGTVAGANGLVATVAGLPPVSFATTAAPGALARLVVYGGNDQRAPVGTQLISPLIARATDAFDNPLRGVTVSWVVTQGGGALSATSTVTDGQGQASVYWSLGTAPGTNTVTATAAGVDPAVFTAVGTVGAAVSVTRISSESGTGVVGTTIPDSLAVVVRDGAGVPAPGVTVSWRTSAGTTSPASVATGADGIARTRLTLGTVPGTHTVTATVDGLTPVGFNFTAVAGPAARVAIAAHPETVYVGRTLQLSAVATDAYGNAASEAVTWSLISDSPAAVSVSPSGLVTGVREGTPKVVAVAGSAADTAALTVLHPVTAVTVTMAKTSIHVADTTRATVLLQTDFGAVTRPYTFSSSNPEAATIDSTGLITAHALGWTNIAATTADGATGWAQLLVAPYGAARLVVSPDSATLSVGDTLRLAATIYDSTGQATSVESAKWFPLSSSVADVAPSGTVYARAPGRAAIIGYLDSGPRDTAWVTVKAGPIARIVVGVGTGTVYPGDSIMASAIAYDAADHVVTGETFTWSSSDPAVARVRANNTWTGYVSGVKGGVAAIVATAGGISGSAQVDVYTAMTWTAMSSTTGDQLVGVWGTSPTDVFAIADRRVLHFDGGAWTTTDIADTSFHAERIWGTSPTNVFVGGFTMAGSHGLLWHYDGAQWSPISLPAIVPTNSSVQPKAIWASAVNDVWAVYRDPALGRDRLAHFTGATSWAIRDFTLSMSDIWGTSATNMWVTASNGAVWRFDGTNSTAAMSSTSGATGTWLWSTRADTALAYVQSSTSTGSLYQLARDPVAGGTTRSLVYIQSSGRSQPTGTWAASSYDVYVANGALYRYVTEDGANRELTLLAGNWLAVWGSGDTVFVVGNDGTIMRGTPAPDDRALAPRRRRPDRGHELTSAVRAVTRRPGLTAPARRSSLKRYL